MPRASSGVLSGGVRTFATLASSGAAVVSILSFLHSWGVIGTPDVRASIGAMGAKWIGVRPLEDTARALRDTLHLAATITDRNGAILYGARPTWTSEDPSVATVEQDGSVIARAAGVTTVIALIGDLSARTRIVVHPTVHRVRLAGDSAVAMVEGDSRALVFEAFDRRGYVIPARRASWSVQEGAVILDSSGRVTAVDAGNAIVNVAVDGVSAQALVRVAPAPAAITTVKGGKQSAPAGRSLREPLVVRVVNRRGNPVEGTLVRFRADSGSGIVDPAAVVTDADGRARTVWTLGEQPGLQAIRATVERVDSALVLTADALPLPGTVRVVALRDSARGIVGRSVGVIGVRVTDSLGRAMPGVRVSWTALDGARAVAEHERTDSLGEARATWTLGNRVGAQRLRATLDGGAGASTITAIAEQNPAVVALQAKARKDSAAKSKPRSSRSSRSTPAKRTGVRSTPRG